MPRPKFVQKFVVLRLEQGARCLGAGPGAGVIRGYEGFAGESVSDRDGGIEDDFDHGAPVHILVVDNTVHEMSTPEDSPFGSLPQKEHARPRGQRRDPVAGTPPTLGYFPVSGGANQLPEVVVGIVLLVSVPGQ